ncbi:MAG TPA: response regulator [Thermomicrobiaceae bacterium]|nr:response regulator [Thermomicrobiaceae bacterium]
MGQTEQPAPRNKHVFVIDGSVDILSMIRELLQDERYNVTTTNFVPRTWEQIAGLQPDLLMVDLVAGYRVGWDLLERLQLETLTRNIPVIVFSTDAKLLRRAEQQADRFGGQRFIIKPFDVDELLAAVNELVGTAESGDPSNDEPANGTFLA